MWQYTPTEELYHWGVKGMKWGHRKAKESSGGTSKPKSKQDQIDELSSKINKIERKKKAKTAVKIALGTVGLVGAGALAVKAGKSISKGANVVSNLLSLPSDILTTLL